MDLFNGRFHVVNDIDRKTLQPETFPPQQQAGIPLRVFVVEDHNQLGRHDSARDVDLIAVGDVLVRGAKPGSSETWLEIPENIMLRLSDHAVGKGNLLRLRQRLEPRGLFQRRPGRK